MLRTTNRGLRNSILNKNILFARNIFISNAEKNKMIKIGYSEEQISSFNETDFKFFRDNTFTSTEEMLLRKLEYSDESINTMNRALLTLSSLNQDDGSGMRPMTRLELVETILKRHDYMQTSTKVCQN